MEVVKLQTVKIGHSYDKRYFKMLIMRCACNISLKDFQWMDGTRDFVEELSEFEFVFVTAPYDGPQWMRDPPG